MTVRRLALAALALAAATACGARAPTRHETADQVAALIRAEWGSTKGMPGFNYSCRRLDGGGHLFTCVVKDQNRWVSLARFDVTCDADRCTWTDYPSYVG